MVYYWSKYETTDPPRYMAEILLIWPQTLSNQSINLVFTETAAFVLPPSTRVVLLSYF